MARRTRFDYVRRYYGVPAGRGVRIRVRDTDGSVECATITSADHHLIARPDHVFPTSRLRYRFHPTWNVQYLGKDGEVIADFWTPDTRPQGAIS